MSQRIFDERCWIAALDELNGVSGHTFRLAEAAPRAIADGRPQPRAGTPNVLFRNAPLPCAPERTQWKLHDMVQQVVPILNVSERGGVEQPQRLRRKL